MCKYFSFGKINFHYKYIFLYVIFQLLNQYLFSKEILPKFGTFNRTLITNHKIIQEIFNYIGVFIISIFLFIYEKYQQKRKNKNDNDNEKLIDRKYSNFSHYKLIYQDQLEGKISIIKIMIIIFLLVLEAQSMNTFYACGLDGLDFWMFEMLFIYFISSRMLKAPMYKHQKCSVFFVLFFCSIIKIISTSIGYHDEGDNIYKTYKIIIPIGIIIFLIITYLRAYVSCKIKWIMDLKYISSNKLLIIYGLMGIIICSICCIITTSVPCDDVIISHKEMINICRQNRTTFDNNLKNHTYNYYDSYSVYYEKLFTGDKFFIFKNICLIIIKVIIIFFVKLFSILIIKYLNPLYFICSSSIYYFFLRLIKIIVHYINKDKIEKKIYLDFVAEIFSIFGILVYTELIELNFWNLNYNLKKNIIKRSLEDSTPTELINNVNNDDSIINENENKNNNDDSEIYE